jgi:hypothetical protein
MEYYKEMNEEGSIAVDVTMIDEVVLISKGGVGRADMATYTNEVLEKMTEYEVESKFKEVVGRHTKTLESALFPEESFDPLF